MNRGKKPANTGSGSPVRKGGEDVTSTPTPEPGPHSRACGWRPHDHGSACSTNCPTCHGRPAPSTPGEGTGRPGGWVEGIGWVALFHDLPEGTRFLSHSASEPPITSIVGVMCSPDDWENYPVIVTRWADGTTPAPPASPADDVPDADAVAFQNGYRIGVRVGSEHHGPCRGLPPASPVPPTPTPCPYIVTGGEGTSYCSLAERSAMHAAAPPSTPADPRPTDPTGSEA